MSKELIVSGGRHETRVAILEDDQVVELFYEREKEYSLAGSIHKGRVTRVLPGMQSAFVDIGLERDAFLYVSDFFEDNEEYDAVVSTVEEKVLKMEKVAGPGPVDYRTVEAEPAAVESAQAESPVIPVAPPSENGGASSREPRPDRPDGGGGRGRRGRRRRGGRGSGLPESKFFSPRTESATASAAAEAEPPAPELVVSSTRTVQISEDFIVLPGESLAKYSPGDSADDEPEPWEKAAETPSAMTAHVGAHAGAMDQPPIESALPEEHPLAGFGAVASWVNEIAAEETPDETADQSDREEDQREARPLDENSAIHLVVAPGKSDREAQQEPETSAPEPPVAHAHSSGLHEPGRPEPGFEAAEALEGSHEEPLENTGSPEQAAAEQGSPESINPEPVNEEGPEPARIPTSLTATLREQGHRYPHRVSRRMRRKMRGGHQGEEGQPQPNQLQPNQQQPNQQQPSQPQTNQAQTQQEAAAETKTVAPQREERRPAEIREPREVPARQADQRAAKERPERERPPLPSISDLLKEGQEIIVQIAKEPLGQKGARITSHIALPGRFVVYMPTVEHVGVSRKIPSDEERQRLKRVLQTHRQGVPGGFICRTAAENKSEEELRSDMHFLYNLWLDMRQKAEKKPAPVLLHHDLDLVQRILRDQLTTSFKSIWVDNEELYESILSFVQRFQPALVGRVKLYTRSNPVFDEFGITGEVEKALRPKVWLKSGGYIVINQTEALVAIDINTGKYVGKSNRLEDTIVKTNTDAIKEIVRQIRLRDLGGIIVVDFIDMDERKNRQKVMLALEEAMRADRAPYKILQFNDFGLVAITRKRVKQSLERTLCSPCTYCEGAGYIKSVGTVISEILQEAQKVRKALEAEQSTVVLRVNPEVAKALKSNQNTFLPEIEEILGKSVLVKSDPLLHQTRFDLA